MADMFTKAEEHGRGKKIAFENAAVNLRKDMEHLPQHALKGAFYDGEKEEGYMCLRSTLCFIFPRLIHSPDIEK